MALTTLLAGPALVVAGILSAGSVAGEGVANAFDWAIAIPALAAALASDTDVDVRRAVTWALGKIA